MHAVGDRADRHVVLVEGRPQPVEHPAGDLTVELRDTVGALREPEPHHGHVEHARVAALVVLGAEREDLVGRDTLRGAVPAEVLRDQVAREPVDAGRHRGVRREHGAGARHLERRVEVEVRAGLVDGELADPFDAEEAGVALVGVEHLRRGPAGQPRVDAQRADTADAEQQLLEQPVFAGAAVQAVRDVTEHAVVLLHVGVEQQQGHSADLGDPDPRNQLAAAGYGDRDPGRRAVLFAQQRDGKPIRVEDRVGLLLPALTGERLAEVAVPVEQADPDDRHAQVGGRLEVIAGQDAQAAGVLRQHGGDAELGREVGDRSGPLRLGQAPGTSARRSGRRRGRRRQPRAARQTPCRPPARSAAACAPHRAGAPGRGRSRPTVRGRRPGRRPGSRGAMTSAG